MVAFYPIAPAVARGLLGGIGEADVDALLADFVEAGLIKAYARFTETMLPGGGRTEVRDARIDRDVWRRIVADGKLPDIWSSGSVRLEADGIVGGRPAVRLIGIRFDETAVRDAAIKHGAVPVAVAPAAKTRRIAAATAPIATAPTDAPPLIEIVPSPRTRMGLAPDVLCVSVTEAMDILDVSRTTLYALNKRGEIEMRKVGGRTQVDADSIRRLLGVDA